MPSTLGEAVDKLNPLHSTPLTDFKNLSPTLTHVYGNYPIVKEVTDALLEIGFVNYVATFTANLYLDFKSAILDKYFTFINDLITFLDNYFKTFIFVNGIDYWIPVLGKLHLSDFYLSNQWKYFQSLSYSVAKWFESVLNPVVTPVLKYVNSSFEHFIENYLPKGSLNGSVSTSPATNGVVISPDDTKGGLLKHASQTTIVDAASAEQAVEEAGSPEITKFFELSTVAFDRVQPLVQKEISRITAVPKQLRSQVSKSSNGIARSIGLKKSKSEGTAEETQEEASGSLTSPLQDTIGNGNSSGVETAKGAATNGSTIQISA